jgi:hypothetical protein
MKIASDLTHDKLGFALWCLPATALIAGLAIPNVRVWLWIPAFLVMGVACLANAMRCHRTHCYITGPLFLGAALYVGLSAIHLVPLYSGLLLNVVLVLTVLGFLVEVPLGKYR